jgi:chromate transporter
MVVGPPSQWQLSKYFLKLGATGFGGPIALTAAMQRDLVERRAWFSQEEFKKGMVLSQLAPGPLAAQMSMYFGWAQKGWSGAALTGLSFVLPSFLMVIALAIAYIRFQSLPWIQSLFLGMGPTIIAIISIGAWKLFKRNLEGDKALWAIALINAILTALLEAEVLSVFILSGVIFALYKRGKFRTGSLMGIAPLWFTEGLSGTASTDTLKDILIFFAKSGAVVFGSGLAIVPFLHGGVVQEFKWLTERQFVDAVAIAMITPGPVVITVGFIGYLVGGFVGAALAAIGVFLPCYFFTVVPAPFFEQVVKREWIKDLVNGITAAAVGAIAGAVVVIAQRSVHSWQGVVLGILAFILLMKFKKIPEPILILVSGIFGLFLF